jgi:hypothetical protein
MRRIALDQKVEGSNPSSPANNMVWSDFGSPYLFSRLLRSNRAIALAVANCAVKYVDRPSRPTSEDNKKCSAATLARTDS